MLLREGQHLIDLANGYIFTKREVLSPVFEGKHHRFAHTSESSFFWKAKVEVEFNVARNLDNAPLNDEDIRPLLCHTNGDVARPGHIANDRAWLKVFRHDNRRIIRSDGDDYVRLPNQVERGS